MLSLDTKDSFNNEINEIIYRIFDNFENIKEYAYLTDLPESIILSSNDISFIVHFNRILYTFEVKFLLI